MSWSQPQSADHALVADLDGDPAQSELLRLAEALSPALRASPALVRAARLAFLPASEVDVEGELLFSDLAVSAGATDLVFSPGVARVLADRLAAAPRRHADARGLIDSHSRHWHPLDRLGQALHWAVFDNDPQAARTALRRALRVIVEAASDDERRDVAAWARVLLPGYADALAGLEEYGWLLRYAALASDDGGGLLSSATPADTTLPAWLAASAPASEAVTVSLRWYPGWLVGGPPGSGDHDIPLPGDAPSPVRLRFPDLPAEPSRFVPLGPASRINLPEAARRIEIETLTGQRFALQAEAAPAAAGSAAPATPRRRVRLLYAPEDHEAARRAATLLEAHGIEAVPLPIAAGDEVLTAPVTGLDDAPLVVRLWSRAARRAVPSATPGWSHDWRGLVLRLDDTAVDSGIAHAATLDMPGLLGAVTDSEQAALAAALDELLEADPQAPRADTAATGEAEHTPPGVDAVVLHAPADREHAVDLVSRLTALGLRVSSRVALENTSAKDIEATVHVLRATAVLVPLVSKATGPTFGADELRAAAPTEDDRSGPSVTIVRLADVPLPDGLRKHHPFDLFVEANADLQLHRLAERLQLLARLGHDEAEIAVLLEELDDPATEPPRRLEIGDRLDELGDPRPGVGVVEFKVGGAEPDAPESALGDGDATSKGHPPDVQRLLDELKIPTTEPPRRLAIGDELERLGDPRPGVGLRADGLPDIAWVEVPAGPFVWQEGETRELLAFWLARFPVTNAQYQVFVDDGGYADDAWWVGLRKPKPRTSLWPQGNRPRTNVDWHEAVAFSRWLSMRLRGDETSIRLPTEVEWEKAARGERGLLYPWGEGYRSGHANVNETVNKDGRWYLEQTTAVGVYPHGASPYGIHDLSGTVREWCLNRYEDVEDIRIDDSGAARALRGGSWRGLPRNARTDYRFRLAPVGRNHSWGFRVLSSVPMVAG